MEASKRKAAQHKTPPRGYSTEGVLLGFSHTHQPLTSVERLRRRQAAVKRQVIMAVKKNPIRLYLSGRGGWALRSVTV